ncbi:GNAT family N-acetyltransferase [Pelosinus sp. IPA-1]|uniref:GNAT family N-acetyltransferase n=1 Tax=Pelosinus sp. IPA-1 TaxID=3029569 RepID=UPI0024362735|nr:GNAT family N-acetyltransferase [Pelosinus sp. IPA-1]GMA97887.1 N-acetyltransferase [Pelosinus sp. IPA-1]
MDIIYRTGREEDSLKIAEGIDRASGGIVEFLFHDLLDQYTPTQVMAKSIKEKQGTDSYENAIVAEYQGNIVGIVYSYSARYHGITDNTRSFFPNDRLTFLKDFYNSRVEDSWFLDSIYVDGAFRGTGIGSKLIELTKQRAKDNGYNRLSLMVMADNAVARRTYERNQFEIVKHIDVQEHRLIPHKGGIYLLVSNLNDNISDNEKLGIMT